MISCSGFVMLFRHKTYLLTLKFTPHVQNSLAPSETNERSRLSALFDRFVKRNSTASNCIYFLIPYTLKGIWTNYSSEDILCVAWIIHRDYPHLKTENLGLYWNTQSSPGCTAPGAKAVILTCNGLSSPHLIKCNIHEENLCNAASVADLLQPQCLQFGR